MKSGQGGRLDVPLQRRPCTRPSRAVAIPRCCSWLDREATASTRPPLRHGRGTRHHWLRTAQLNAVGWAALIGLCLVAAAAGVATAWAIGVPRWSGVSLGVLPLGGVVPLDRRRWAAAMDTSVGWGGSEADVAGIASEPAKRGVTTRVRTEPPTEGWPEPAYGRGGREDPQGGRLCRLRPSVTAIGTRPLQGRPCALMASASRNFREGFGGMGATRRYLRGQRVESQRYAGGAVDGSRPRRWCPRQPRRGARRDR